MISNTGCPTNKINYDYDTLMHTIPAGFAVFQLISNNDESPDDYRFLSINSVFEKITQLKSADITNRTLMEILPDTGKYWTGMFYHVSDNSELVVFEHYSADFDKFLQVSVSFSFPSQLFCSLIDITGRKKTEAKLLEVQIIANIGRGELDLVSGCLEWSEGIFDLFEISRKDFPPLVSHSLCLFILMTA